MEGEFALSERMGMDVATLRFRERMRVLSPAALNGGLVEADGLVIIQVPEDRGDAESVLRETVADLGMEGIVVGIASGVDDPRMGEATEGRIPVRAAAMGEHALVVMCDVPLSDAAMVEAAMVARGEGHCRTVAVICPEGAGGASAEEVGEAVSAAVRGALPEARDILGILRERCVGVDDLWEAALGLYCPCPEWDTSEVKGMFLSKLRTYSNDVNVTSMILGAVQLEGSGERGEISGLPVELFAEDPVHLVADEMLGIALAQYIAGTRGLFEYTRYDKRKPGVIGTLGPFMDDIVGALVGGIMSSIYTQLLEGGD